MQFNKKLKLGVIILCLLLLFSTGISLININKQNNGFDKNLLSLSAAEDYYETMNGRPNNNEFANASDIRTNKGNWLPALGNGNGTLGDVDYYLINASAGQQINIILNHSYSQGQMNISLWNITDVFATNNIPVDILTINYTVTIGGNYCIIVKGGDYPSAYTYDLWWSIDDIYEDNDDFWSAKSLVPNLLYQNLTIFYDDADWFKLDNLTYGDFLNISIFFSNSEGDLELELYNPSYVLKSWSYSFTDKEEIVFNATDPGDWRIRVYHAVKNSDVNYTLDIRVNGSVFVGDSFEPNEDFANAWPIGSGYWNNLEIIGGDEDWFQLNLIVGDIIDIDIYFNTTEGNLELELWSPSPSSSGTLQVSSYSYTGYEYIYNYNITEAGNWRFRVFHKDKNSTVKYDLYLYVYMIDDAYEENDYIWNAKDITTSKNSWISGLRQKDDDLYNITLAPGKDRIFVQIEFLHAAGDIDMELYNNVNGIIGTGNSVTDNEYIEVYFAPIVVETKYLIKIYGFPNDTSNTYALRWSDSGFYDDIYEQNDNYSAAYNLSSNEASWLSPDPGPHPPNMGPGIQWDDDWYIIEADPGEERLNVTVVPVFSLAYIRFEIYAYNGSNLVFPPMASINGTTIEINVPEPGFYCVRVFGDNLGYGYDLWWEDLPSSDDNYEENDFDWNAFYIPPNEGLPFGDGIQGDNDWYKFDLGPDVKQIYVELTFTHEYGNIDLELWCWNLSVFTQIAGSYSFDNDEFIDVNATQSRTYYILVFGENKSNQYDLRWSPKGMDDFYEENDAWNQAWDLSNVEDIWLGSLYSGEGIQGDDDWYMIDVEMEEGHLIVEINFDNFEGNIDLELYDSSQSLLASSNTRDNYEFVDYEFDSSGTYYIRVFGENKGNWYNLKWRTQDEAKDFYDDSYEPNNNRRFGYVLWDDEWTWLNNIAGLAVQGDDDWYKIDVTPGFEQLVVEVTFNHSAGDIDISIFEEQNPTDPIIGNYSVSDNEYIDFNVSHPGLYYIQIHGENAGNEYDLRWDDLRTLFAEDDYEPNNGHLNATDLTEYDNFEYEDFLKSRLKTSADEPNLDDVMSLKSNVGFGLQYDEDWYEIYVPDERLNLLILLKYDYAEGAIGLIVYDGNLKEVAENFTRHDNEYINIKLRNNGTYYIRVFGDDTGNVYNLIWATSDYEIAQVPGYDILILLGSLFGIASIIVFKWKRSKLKHK